jgi:catechol 2,3-dioxygenase
MSTASAPVEIGHVSLVVRDLAGMTEFYRQAIGLREIGRDGESVSLGAGGRVLVELRSDPSARPRNPRDAGLFHTALLMPSRADLAAWLIHAANAQVRLQGASDHLVSEAIYLADPEGNGIEVYADRPRLGWYDAQGKVKIATEALDLNALARAATGPWQGAPEGAVVGHVHLQVGAVPEADAFYGGTLGLPVMATYPGASFFGSGGYHHHIAANIWNSRGAGRREPGAAGLAEVVLLADAQEHAAIVGRAGGETFADPWGTTVSVRRKAA